MGNYNFKAQYKLGLECQRRIRFAEDRLPPTIRSKAIREAEQAFCDLDEEVRIAVDFTLYPHLYEGETYQDYIAETNRLNAQ